MSVLKGNFISKRVHVMEFRRFLFTFFRGFNPYAVPCSMFMHDICIILFTNLMLYVLYLFLMNSLRSICFVNIFNYLK